MTTSSGCPAGPPRDSQVVVFRKLGVVGTPADHVFGLVDLDASDGPLCTVLVNEVQRAWRVVEVRGDRADDRLLRVAQDLTAAAIAAGVSRIVASPEASVAARRVVSLAVGETVRHDGWVIAKL